MCDVGNKLTERYITLVPRDFAKRHFDGRFLLCGQAGVSGTAGSSQGPCAVVLAPPRTEPTGSSHPRTGMLVSTTLLFYPESRKFRDDRGPWGRADKVWSAAWIDDGSQHWLAFAALVGKGVAWYGEADRPPQGAIVDRWIPAKGYHAPPYEERLYIFSADDLARVAGGEMSSWQVTAAKVYDLRPALLNSGRAVVALAFDAARRRLYVCEDGGDATQSRFEKLPVVHAYDLEPIPNPRR
jgi:hypothetical protein